MLINPTFPLIQAASDPSWIDESPTQEVEEVAERVKQILCGEIEPTPLEKSLMAGRVNHCLKEYGAIDEQGGLLINPFLYNTLLRVVSIPTNVLDTFELAPSKEEYTQRSGDIERLQEFSLLLDFYSDLRQLAYIFHFDIADTLCTINQCPKAIVQVFSPRSVARDLYQQRNRCKYILPHLQSTHYWYINKQHNIYSIFLNLLKKLPRLSFIQSFQEKNPFERYYRVRLESLD